MTGPLQQHDSRFRERNLLLLSLLGLISCARRSRRLLLESCGQRVASDVSNTGDFGPPSRSLLLVLGIVSFGKTIEQHVTGLASEKPPPSPASSDLARPQREPLALRSLLR
jgi:hypothetical protein